MHLARVTGAVVSTQKSPSLNGKKLLLVRRVSTDDEHPFPPGGRFGGRWRRRAGAALQRLERTPRL